MRHFAAPGIALSLSTGLLLTGCGGSSASSDSVDPTPAPTVTVTVTPEPSGDQIDIAAESPSPTLIQPDVYRGIWEDEQGRYLLDGSWHVGAGLDIEPGAIVFTDADFECLWRIIDENQQIAEEGASNLDGLFSLTLQDGDVFQSWRCKVWSVIEDRGSQIREEAPERDLSSELGTDSVARGNPISGGSYIVGKNGLKPGYYYLTPKTTPDGPCAFSVSSQISFSDGMYLPEETFQSTNAGARSNMKSVGPRVLEEGDLFETDGCGEWQRYELVPTN